MPCCEVMCVSLIILVVHRHGRGKRLGTCLVVKPCASCFVSLQYISIFDYVGDAWAWTRHASWYFPCGEAVYINISWVCGTCLYFIMPVVHGHGRGKRLGTCLVQQYCISSIVTLQHVWMCQCPSWVQACTRHTARQTANVRCAYRGLCYGRHQC